MPKVSVIVPVYNAEKYLSACVDSILAQTLTDIEVILVDDGSTDSSPALCDVYAEKDHRVHVIHKCNGGVSSARNKGLDAACGEYITFVDSDDYIDSGMYAHMWEKIEELHCDVVMCDCLKEYLNRSERYSHNIRPGYYDRPQIEGEYFPHLLMMEDLEYPATISNCLILFCRRIAFSESIRYVEGVRYSEDLLFGAQLLFHASSFYYLKDKCFYHYRMNPQSATHRFVKDKWNDYLKLHQKIEEEFGTCMAFDFQEQIDRCLLFFLHNAVGDILRTKQLSLSEKRKRILSILRCEKVRKMFDRFNIEALPISGKLKTLTYLFKYRIAIAPICLYYGKRS